MAFVTRTILTVSALWLLVIVLTQIIINVERAQFHLFMTRSRPGPGTLPGS